VLPSWPDVHKLSVNFELGAVNLGRWRFVQNRSTGHCYGRSCAEFAGYECGSRSSGSITSLVSCRVMPLSASARS
jgi:hypothetical protein